MGQQDGVTEATDPVPRDTAEAVAVVPPVPGPTGTGLAVAARPRHHRGATETSDRGVTGGLGVGRPSLTGPDEPPVGAAVAVRAARRAQALGRRVDAGRTNAPSLETGVARPDVGAGGRQTVPPEETRGVPGAIEDVPVGGRRRAPCPLPAEGETPGPATVPLLPEAGAGLASDGPFAHDDVRRVGTALVLGLPRHVAKPDTKGATRVRVETVAPRLEAVR